ncbi:hypothetical protein M9Y10_023058 [Tritrichomonas musculus]|uniref:Uncharacterized protein n=1 Tax=Tritrichomonas musculus TaxID=1915356 RepID=A0ABR2KV17_9EUKA
MKKAKEAFKAIGEAMATTSNEKPVNGKEFNEIIYELKKTEIKSANPQLFIPKMIEKSKINYSKYTSRYLNESVNLFKKSEVHFFEDHFTPYEILSFDQILSNSIEKVTVQDKVNFDFFDFCKLR